MNNTNPRSLKTDALILLSIVFTLLAVAFALGVWGGDMDRLLNH